MTQRIKPAMNRRAPIAALFCLLLAGCQFMGGGDSAGPAEPTPTVVPASGPVLGGTVTVTPLGAPTPSAKPSGQASAAPAPAAGPAKDSAPQTAMTPPAEAAPAALPPPPPKSAAQLACEAKGGQWGRAGATSAMTCFDRTRDAGKSCRRESDCSTLCLARSRTCAPVTPLFGCHPVLQDDGREVTLCTD